MKAVKPRADDSGLTVVLVSTAYWQRNDKTVSVCATTHGNIQRTTRFQPGNTPMDDHLSAAMVAASAGLMKAGLPDRRLVSVAYNLDGKAAARFTLRYRTDPDSDTQPPLDGDLCVTGGFAQVAITVSNLRRTGEVMASWCNGAVSVTRMPDKNDPCYQHLLAAKDCAADVLARLDITPTGPFLEPEQAPGFPVFTGERTLLLRCPVVAR